MAPIRTFRKKSNDQWRRCSGSTFPPVSWVLLLLYGAQQKQLGTIFNQHLLVLQRGDSKMEMSPGEGQIEAPLSAGAALQRLLLARREAMTSLWLCRCAPPLSLATRQHWLNDNVRAHRNCSASPTKHARATDPLCSGGPNKMLTANYEQGSVVFKCSTQQEEGWIFEPQMFF